MLGYDQPNSTNYINNPYRWQNAYMETYHERGVQPEFITCNAFTGGNVPTPSEWEDTIGRYRDVGLEEQTHIFATFEYQNYVGHHASLESNKVSDRSDFQDIITTSGGLVLRTPPSLFLETNHGDPLWKEAAYREWIVDAIQWTQENGFLAAVIIPPHTAGEEYDEKTETHIDCLCIRNAPPQIYIVENYTDPNNIPPNYLNVVGSEDTTHHQLGSARLLKTDFIP